MRAAARAPAPRRCLSLILYRLQPVSAGLGGARRRPCAASAGAPRRPAWQCARRPTWTRPCRARARPEPGPGVAEGNGLAVPISRGVPQGSAPAPAAGILGRRPPPLLAPRIPALWSRTRALAAQAGTSAGRAGSRAATARRSPARPARYPRPQGFGLRLRPPRAEQVPSSLGVSRARGAGTPGSSSRAHFPPGFVQRASPRFLLAGATGPQGPGSSRPRCTGPRFTPFAAAATASRGAPGMWQAAGLVPASPARGASSLRREAASSQVRGRPNSGGSAGTWRGLRGDVAGVRAPSGAPTPGSQCTQHAILRETSVAGSWRGQTVVSEPWGPRLEAAWRHLASPGPRGDLLEEAEASFSAPAGRSLVWVPENVLLMSATQETQVGGVRVRRSPPGRSQRSESLTTDLFAVAACFLWWLGPGPAGQKFVGAGSEDAGLPWDSDSALGTMGALQLYRNLRFWASISKSIQ